MNSSSSFNLGVDQLTPKKLLKIASHQLGLSLSSETKKKLRANNQAVQNIVAGEKLVYSINTGFGPLCRTKISPENSRKLQENILRSHAVGVGTPISKDLARMMMAQKIHSLCQGVSGVSVELVETLIQFFQSDVIGVVPCQGSVGASGDLAPLAHLFLPLIGLGHVYTDSGAKPSEEVLKQKSLKPYVLGPKEGLALLNGTQFILAHGVLALKKFHNCLEVADLVGALSLEAMLGSAQPFRKELHCLRPFSGALHVAHRVSTLLSGSELVESHVGCERVQDPYSLRCIPQVHGTSRDAWRHVADQVGVELNAVTDNPLVLSEHDTISGGNFHGQPLALPLDYLSLAACELGSISERRTYLMLEGRDGLPLLLMKDTGINSGFMIPQYTAAALVSENKSLVYPASADSIPTSVGQEDHVSMGSISGRKALQIVGNLEMVLAIEALCAAQAFDFRRPLKSSPILEACHDLIRSRIPHAIDDRIFSEDMEALHGLICDGSLLEVAEQTAKTNGVDLNGARGSLFSLE